MVTTQEKQKYCNILQVELDASQEEIAKAYKKMALKYHPDRNHGKEEWAKQEFIKIGEAYAVLSGKQKSGSSNKFSSDAEFEKFKEMFEEVEREFKETKREFYEYKENKKQEDKAARSKAIRDIEEALTLSNVSISELDSSLWSPYSDWKEKVENSVGSGIDVFSGDMRIDINRAKRAKINNSSSGQGGYTHGSYSEKNHYNQGKYGDYDKPLPNFSDKNFSPNNSGWTGENKSSSTSGDKIAKLEDEIEWNKQYLLKTSDESEKQKCRKIIAGLEKELRKLKGSSNSDKDGGERGEFANSNYGSSSNYSDSNDNSNKKDEKINQLENEIEQLKKNRPWDPRKRNEHQKKIAEKEQELSELEKNNKDNTDNLNQEELINTLINEIERLKKENKKDDLTKKVSQLEKVIQQLVKEIQELKTEIKELKNKNNRSEYENYYLSKQENQLKNNQSKLEQLRMIVDSNSNSNSNDFPVGWVVGGGILVALGLVMVLIVKKWKKKKR